MNERVLAKKKTSVTPPQATQASSPLLHKSSLADELSESVGSTSNISKESAGIQPKTIRRSLNWQNISVEAPSRSDGRSLPGGIQRQQEEPRLETSGVKGQEESTESLQMQPDEEIQAKSSSGESPEKEEQNHESVQTKLTVGAPGDKHEQEADSMAGKVMTMPDSAVEQPIQRQTEEQEQFKIMASASKEEGVGKSEVKTNVSDLVADIAELSLSNHRGTGFGKVFLIATVNGQPVGSKGGKFNNTPGKHAEENLLNALTGGEWQKLAHQDKAKANVIQIQITSSPCGNPQEGNSEAEKQKYHGCAYQLDAFVKQKEEEGYIVKLAIATEGIYKGENSESSTEALQHLIREGHEVNIWEFSQQLEPLVKASNLEQPKKEAIIRKAKSKETRAKNVIEKINNIDEGK